MEFERTIDTVFTNNNSLLDTSLEEILINRDKRGERQVRLTFTNFRPGSDFKEIQVLFQDVHEFSFRYTKDYHFYYVEDYKLMKLEGNIYISLDPDKSIISRSEDDLDFILAEKASIIKE